MPADIALFLYIVTKKQDNIAVEAWWIQHPSSLDSNPSSASYHLSGLGKWHDHPVPQCISKTGNSSTILMVAKRVS